MSTTSTTTTSTPTATDPTRPAPGSDPRGRAISEEALAAGLGARITVAAMIDNYVDVILGALNDESLDTSGLQIETGDVSTLIRGDEPTLLRYLTDVSARIAESGVHASITILLSRGCPGEVTCEAPRTASAHHGGPPDGRDVGTFASAEWALYPLADQVTVTDDGRIEPDHMRDIYVAIDLAKDLGTFHSSVHFATRLEGDLGRVLQTAVAGWTLVGRSVQHVTSHLTVSVNSPSHSHG